MSTEFLKIEPSILKFPFEAKKQCSCCLSLINESDRYVAFKVKTTKPKAYSVRPNRGLVLPWTTCHVIVKMQAVEALPSMQGKHDKHKFLVQSFVAEPGLRTEDINSEMFDEEPGKVLKEFKLKVAHISSICPSTASDKSVKAGQISSEEGSCLRSNMVVKAEPISSKEGSSLGSNMVVNGEPISSVFVDISRAFKEPSREKPSEAQSMISMLIEEKSNVTLENQHLRQKLELLRKKVRKGRLVVFVIFVILMTLLGFLSGHFIKKI